jgi:hypothetical protein
LQQTLVDLQAAAAARLKDKSDIFCAATDGLWSVVFHHLLAYAGGVNAKDEV